MSLKVHVRQHSLDVHLMPNLVIIYFFYIIFMIIGSQTDLFIVYIFRYCKIFTSKTETLKTDLLAQRNPPIANVDGRGAILAGIETIGLGGAW